MNTQQIPVDQTKPLSKTIYNRKGTQSQKKNKTFGILLCKCLFCKFEKYLQNKLAANTQLSTHKLEHFCRHALVPSYITFRI